MYILSHLRNHLLCIPPFRKSNPSSSFRITDTLTPSATPGAPSFSSSRTGSDTPTLFSPGLPPVSGDKVKDVIVSKEGDTSWGMPLAEPLQSASGGGQPKMDPGGNMYGHWDDGTGIEARSGARASIVSGQEDWSETESENGSSLRGGMHLDNIPEEDENENLVVLWDENNDEPIVVAAGALGG
ncbi:hypothetical protein IAT38_000137 [Cryptococcus sp. DSM 104549]